MGMGLISTAWPKTSSWIIRNCTMCTNIIFIWASRRRAPFSYWRCLVPAITRCNGTKFYYPPSNGLGINMIGHQQASERATQRHPGKRQKKKEYTHEITVQISQRGHPNFHSHQDMNYSF